MLGISTGSKGGENSSTGWDAPGNFTQSSWSSLYFWKAGFSLLISSGWPSEVRAFMSLTTSLSSPGGAPRMKEEHISVVEDIARLYNHETSCSQSMRVIRWGMEMQVQVG